MTDSFKKIQLTFNEATASVVPHGAHALDYQPAGQPPVLWTSELANFEEGKAIRGGVPVIWPWFGSHPTDVSKSSHGVARKIGWQLVGSSDSAASFSLLPQSKQTHPNVDGEFKLSLDIELSDALEIKLTTKNVGSEPFTFSAALHSYFAVGDATKIKITGLDGRTYIDQLDKNQRKLQQGAIEIDQEVDRIYINSADTVWIHDPVLGREIEIAKEGSLSTVVWNPWVAKSRRMADFGDDEYMQMVCVETCNAADDTKTLAPGEAHTLITRISSHEIR